MAICVFKLTKQKRLKVAIAFTIFNTIQVILGAILTGFSIYICTSVSSNLYSERAEITFVFTITALYGTHIILHFLIGNRVCQKCYTQAHKKSTRSLLFLWTMAGFNTILNIIIIAVLCKKISKHIIRSMRHSLEKGMREYLTSSTWSYNIDRVQFQKKCCGINSYKDWYETRWIHKYHIQEDSELVKSLRSSEDEMLLPVTPWSCCRLDFPLPCLHDPFQQIKSSQLWQQDDSLIVQSIHENGCLSVLRMPIESALVGFILVAVLLFCLQLVIVMLSRIVYTASKNAILLNDPDGVAPGWIFGRGDFGWNSGRTLSDIMIEKNESKPNKEPDVTNENEPAKPSRKKSSNRSKSTSQRSSSRHTVSSTDEEALLLL